MLNVDKTPPLYPCDFPVKIIGEAGAEFESEVFGVMKNYIEGLTSDQFGRQLSANGKYLSLTINVFAVDRKYLDKLYAS